MAFSLRFAQLDFVPKNLYIVQCSVPVLLNLLPHLKNIKLQIIGLVRRPENGVVAALGAEIDLAEAFVGTVGGFPDGFGE